MEAYIIELFFQALSLFHYYVSSSKDLEKLNDPQTASYLYNYSLSLLNDTNKYYKQFHYLGYPHDTFAIHFIRERPGFCFYLQCLIIAMVLIFILMLFVLVWYFVFDDVRMRQTKEYQETMEKLRVHHEQLQKAHG